MSAKNSNALTALVTGAAQGIGYELSRLFAQDGYRLILIARREEKLKETAAALEKEFSVEVKIVLKDLSRPQAAQEIYNQLKEENILVDVLVNNAGYGLHNAFYENTLADELSMIDLNIVSLVEMAKLFGADMVERGHGKILNIGSIAAYKPGPFSAIYYGTKAFVVKFSEALAGELQGTGVSVSVLCPGPTRTGFQRRSGSVGNKAAEMNMMPADVVAKIGYAAFKKGQVIIIPGLKNKVMALMFRFLPVSWSLSLVRTVQKTIK